MLFLSENLRIVSFFISGNKIALPLAPVLLLFICKSFQKLNIPESAVPSIVFTSCDKYHVLFAPNAFGWSHYSSESERTKETRQRKLLAPKC